MALTARVFGVNTWSILVPQALMGVATVAALHAAVRRRFPAWAALLAGAALAVTPVAALMFRFNNPDALLVLLLTLGAYAALRAQESASTRWLLLAAALTGTGFLAKMLQAFLVVPVFALVYLLAAPAPCGGGCGSWPPPGECCWPRPGGGSWPSRWCPPPPAPTSAGRSTTPSWNLPSATTASDASTARRPAGSATSTRTPDGAACSGPSSAARSPGCCPPRCSCSPPGCGRRDARPAPTPPAPRWRCGADGSCSPPRSSAGCRASSTSTTPSRSPPRSPRSPAWAPRCCGNAAAPQGPPRSCRRPSPSPPCGPTSCWTGHRTGTPGSRPPSPPRACSPPPGWRPCGCCAGPS
ncbi:glycosyltransferase family 39 protein [Actinomadura luteofluorescens]|uniref:glycosyltransferase family 39 protein n=1 Tax=Actinomadura luteofluorescens TaxID=46163 RepID=UPI00363C0132